MYRPGLAFVFLLALTVATSLAQEKQATKTGSAETAAATKDVDPLAMDVLRAVAEPVEKAQAFHFKALVSEEEVASNGQIVTMFRTVDVTVQRPDKIHLIFRGSEQRVDFFTENGKTVMFAPDSGLYTTVESKKSIDDIVKNLNEKNIDLPIAPFLRSDLYEIAAKTVETGYVIGRVKVFDQDVHQLAFTSPDSDYQLWVTGEPEARFVRAEVVNKNLEGQPRTIIQFLDWNLNPTLAENEFTFVKPADAHEVAMLPAEGAGK